MAKIDQFVAAVLGDQAVTSLNKAVSRREALGSVLGPRVIIGWVNVAAQWSYDGAIPGVEDSALYFGKNENGIEGHVQVGDERYDFSNASPLQLAATLSVALDVSEPTMTVKDRDLVGLGKSIDVLVKSQIVRLLRASVAKTELQGGAAAPQKPEGPETPEAPKKAPKNQLRAAPSTFKIAKNQAEHTCSVCESRTIENGQFVGCYCLKHLAKSVTVQETDNTYELEFGTEWSPGSIQVLKDIVGVK